MAIIQEVWRKGDKPCIVWHIGQRPDDKWPARTDAQFTRWLPAHYKHITTALLLWLRPVSGGMAATLSDSSLTASTLQQSGHIYAITSFVFSYFSSLKATISRKCRLANLPLHFSISLLIFLIKRLHYKLQVVELFHLIASLFNVMGML